LFTGDRRELTAEAPVVLAFDPARVSTKLKLFCAWFGWLAESAELEAGADESKFVNTVGEVIGGAVDARPARGDWRYVNVAVVDANEAEAEVV